MIKKFIKKHLKKLVIAYVLGLPVGNLLLIPSTTNIPFKSVQAIAKTAIEHPINTLTLGTLNPIVSGIEKGIGSISHYIGETTNSDFLKYHGEKLKESGSEWFNLSVGDIHKKSETKNTNVDNQPKYNKTIDSVDETKSKNKQSTSSNNTLKNTDKVEDWTFERYPDYYNVVGVSNIDISKFPAKGKFEYTPVDSLGRATYAKGVVTYDIVSVTGDRQKIPAKVIPSGWGHQGKAEIPYLDGKEYDGYMYNKSHMIADSLGGEPIASNLVTGTRTQNVGYNGKGGMAYSETKVRDYLKSHKNEVVYYEVISHFEGNELLPRYTTVNFMSSDKLLDESVIVYNTANGYDINYKDGTFAKKS